MTHSLAGRACRVLDLDIARPISDGAGSPAVTGAGAIGVRWMRFDKAPLASPRSVRRSRFPRT
jgi:hypothetical protein